MTMHYTSGRPQGNSNRMSALKKSIIGFLIVGTLIPLIGIGIYSNKADDILKEEEIYRIDSYGNDIIFYNQDLRFKPDQIVVGMENADGRLIPEYPTVLFFGDKIFTLKGNSMSVKDYDGNVEFSYPK